MGEANFDQISQKGKQSKRVCHTQFWFPLPKFKVKLQIIYLFPYKWCILSSSKIAEGNLIKFHRKVNQREMSVAHKFFIPMTKVKVTINCYGSKFVLAIT